MGQLSTAGKKDLSRFKKGYRSALLQTGDAEEPEEDDPEEDSDSLMQEEEDSEQEEDQVDVSDDETGYRCTWRPVVAAMKAGKCGSFNDDLDQFCDDLTRYNAKLIKKSMNEQQSLTGIKRLIKMW